MKKFEVMVQSPEAAKLVDELLKELPAETIVDAKKLKTRGVDVMMLVTITSNVATLATACVTIVEWYQKAKSAKEKIIAKATYDGKQVDMDLDSFQKNILGNNK